MGIMKKRRYTLRDVVRGYTVSEILKAQEALRMEYGIAMIDKNLEELADSVGRLLTVQETSDILDVVDEYTPKDKDGNYLGPMLPFDYAWVIYQIKRESKNG
jgi:hypothetical protein